MAESDKRKISAKKILEDIRSGMDNAKLQRRYGLSQEALESIFGKLIKAGALKEFEIRGRLASANKETPETEETTPAEQPICPSCHAHVPAGSTECPKCGIVLSKFVAGHTLTAATLVEFPDIAVSDYQSPNRWLYVVVSIVVLGVIGAGVLLWATHRDKQKLEAVTVESPKAVEETSSAAETSDEASSDDTPSEINPDDESTLAPPGEVGTEGGELEPTLGIREESKEQTAPELQPPQTQTRPIPVPEKSAYLTGEVRRFTSSDFKREVVEASKTYPVLFQFYSDT